MTLRSEIEELYSQANARIRASTTPPGIMRADSDPDPRFVIINANNEAVAQALLKIADRLDAMETDTVA